MKTASNIGRKFRLIGCTLEFIVVHEKLVAGFIPAITGHSADGRMTQPRVVDVVWL
jgi:hypothetical protein